MAVAVTKLQTQRAPNGQPREKSDGPTVRAAIDSFLDSPNVRANPNTLRAYTRVVVIYGRDFSLSPEPEIGWRAVQRRSARLVAGRPAGAWQ